MKSPLKSLQARILAVLAASIILCWAGVLVVFLAYTARGQTGLWDSELEAIGTKIFYSIPSDFSADPGSLARREAIVPPERQDARDRAMMEGEHLAFQVWLNRKQLVVRAPGSPATALRPDFGDGFASTLAEGKRWRVFVISDATGKVQVQVGILQSMLDAELRQRAFGSLGIATLLLVWVGTVMWFALRHSLKPVFAIQEAVRQRQRFDLTPLPVAALPTELRPLVESFNHLLGQVDQAVEVERRFIGDAAHELRTPLAALQAQAQVALRAQTAAEKDAALVKLLTVAERSTRLSEQLLDMARLNAGVIASRQAPADLGELIVHVSREFDVYARQNNRLIMVQTSHCVIHCDIDDIGILLRNLVDNALRYTAEGGRVRMSCSHVVENGANRVCLEVADDGPGVPENEREAVFQRFYRGSGSSGRGSGIGLSLVAGIAQLHRAEIRLCAGLDGRGLGIRILFPALPDELA